MIPPGSCVVERFSFKYHCATLYRVCATCSFPSQPCTSIDTFQRTWAYFKRKFLHPPSSLATAHTAQAHSDPGLSVKHCLPKCFWTQTEWKILCKWNTSPVIPPAFDREVPPLLTTPLEHSFGSQLQREVKDKVQQQTQLTVPER